jgi:hypothetical protein
MNTGYASCDNGFLVLLATKQQSELTQQRSLNFVTTDTNSVSNIITAKAAFVYGRTIRTANKRKAQQD